MLDLVIRGGSVVDGTGAPPRQCDVGVRDGTLAVIGALDDAEASHTIDARGLIVAPGFIDIHSHSDFTLLVDPRARSALAQGVTTEVVGNCGHGCAPILGDPSLYVGNIYGYTPAEDITWSGMDGYLARLEAARPAVNIASLVPNGNLRLAVLGLADRPARPAELAHMQRLLAEALAQGAFGFSTGLEYAAERACTEAEITALVEVTARHDALYATHTRNREVYAAAAVEEAVRTAAAAGARLQISHLVPRRGGPPDSFERTIRAVDDGVALGVDVTFDIHTRLFGLTNLSVVLPPAAFEGGVDALAARLSDPRQRAAMKDYRSLVSSFLLAGPDRLFVLDTPNLPDVMGRSLADLTPPGQDAFDVMYDILLGHVDAVHGPMSICWSHDEDQLATAVAHDRCMLGSDATTLAPDGPLAGATFHGAYTWASWFLRRLVRERQVLSLAEGIRRLTSFPAARVGLVDRGVLRPGARADLAIFDFAHVGERGTFDAPNQLAAGMTYVVVNGTLAIEQGTFTDARSGRVLRRGGTG